MQDTTLKTINTILANTPSWVYILFAYLVYLGIKSIKPRVVPLIKIFILPLIFLLMSWHMLANVAIQNFLQFSTGVLSLVAGMLLGWWHISFFTIRADKKHRLLEVPGTWSILFIVLFVFFSNYFFQFVIGAGLAMAKQKWFIISMLIILGAAKGFLVGRALALWRRFEHPKVVTDLSLEWQMKY